jgi:penicillin-binding protein 1A
VVDKGLNPGEQVIVEGQNQVRPGGKVEPAPPSAGGPMAGSDQGSGSAAAAAAGSGAGGHHGRHGQPGTGTGGGGGTGAGPGDGTGGAGDGSSVARPNPGQTHAREPATGPTASNQPAAQ